MTYRKHLATAALISAVAATPLLAGSYDEPVVEPVIPAAAPMAPSADWTGAYGGLALGYGQTDAGGATTNGLTYGAFGGYDYDFGNWVVGGELDFNAMNDGPLENATRAKLRLGYDAGPALIYATGGAAYGNATIGGTGFDDTGYFYGVGVDYMVTDSIAVGGEITQNKFGDFGGSGTNLDSTNAALRVSMRF